MCVPVINHMKLDLSLNSPQYPSDTDESVWEVADVTLERGGSGLGLSIAGGETGGDVSITRLAAGGSAKKDGRLQIGDILLQVNISTKEINVLRTNRPLSSTCYKAQIRDYSTIKYQIIVCFKFVHCHLILINLNLLKAMDKYALQKNYKYCAGPGTGSYYEIKAIFLYLRAL